MARKNWERLETLVALSIYCRPPFGRLHARNPEIILTSSALERTPSALAMKCCNLASFDPAQQARGISGLSKASRLDHQVWEEFTQNPESVAFEAEKHLASLTQRELDLSEFVEWEDVRGLDQELLTKVRVNQQFFRRMILAGYRNCCAVCELPLQSLLVASHIVPWSIDPQNRMNPINGICLCTLHDKAYDSGLLVVDEDLHISVGTAVLEAAPNPMIEKCLLEYVGRRLISP